MIQLQPVEGSSAIEAAGYDSTTGTLAIRYKNAKTTTHYKNVEPHINEQLMAADSIGSFLHGNVAKAYEAESIPDEDESES